MTWYREDSANTTYEAITVVNVLGDYSADIITAAQIDVLKVRTYFHKGHVGFSHLVHTEGVIVVHFSHIL